MTTRPGGDSRRGPVAFVRGVQGPVVRGGGTGARGTGARAVLRTTGRFLAPRWLLIHVIAFGAAIGMVLLGRWQLHVSDAKHFDLQNFSYVIQWWVFAAFALLFWARLMRDALRPPMPQASPSGQVALRTGPGTVLNSGYTGPAEMVVAGTGTGLAGAEPVLYRGYVIPESATSLHRSQGDDYHESYNDYLWELSLADAAYEDSHPPAQATPTPAPSAPVVGHNYPVIDVEYSDDNDQPAPRTRSS